MTGTTLAAGITIAVCVLLAVGLVANAARDVGIARATGRDPVRDLTRTRTSDDVWDPVERELDRMHTTPPPTGRGPDT